MSRGGFTSTTVAAVDEAKNWTWNQKNIQNICPIVDAGEFRAILLRATNSIEAKVLRDAQAKLE